MIYHILLQCMTCISQYLDKHFFNNLFVIHRNTLFGHEMKTNSLGEYINVRENNENLM